MAAVILTDGERGERRAMPNARIMVHQPTRSPHINFFACYGAKVGIVWDRVHGCRTR